MTRRFVLGMTCGAALAVAGMLACSDDAPGDADAATDAGRCECPAAEPPLANRIVRVTGTPVEVLAVTAGGNTKACPVGAIALGGSCTVADRSSLLEMRLIEAGHPSDGSQAWSCEWFNSSNAPVMVIASVNCYLPPAQ
jgi:hypothetical protein